LNSISGIGGCVAWDGNGEGAVEHERDECESLETHFDGFWQGRNWVRLEFLGVPINEDD